MAALRICSWNVNGLRATVKTGDFRRWLEELKPDIAGLQEVKALPDQVEAATWEDLGYQCHWHPSERPGYSGALLLTREAPDRVQLGIGIEDFDREGRVIEADFGDLTVITAYFPNGGKGRDDRLPFKLSFYERFLEHVDDLRRDGRSVVFMGDLNTAHHEFDVARPAEAIKGTGFLPQEREWLDRYEQHGWVDSFRALWPEARDAYTYWDAWRDRRARNVGWRIDYVFIAEELRARLKAAFIESQVMGSDHCPVGIELEIERS